MAEDSRITGGGWTTRRAVATAWALWAALFLIVSGYVLSGSDKTVTFVYRQAAAHWLGGEPLYTQTGWDFLYLPQAAILFAPLAILPSVAGDILWRFVSISLFSVGVWRLARLGGAGSGVEFFPVMTWVAIPIAFDGARNGQATLACTGLMILAVVALTCGRWWRSTLWLMLALAVKPLAAFLVVLAVIIYRPMRAKVVAGLAALALAPFLFQRPDFVLRQYEAWIALSRTAGENGTIAPFAQIFALPAAVGLAMPAPVQAAVAGAAALATMGLAVAASRRFSPAQAGVTVFALNVCCLMLFNLRTENNTYAAMAPVLGLWMAEAWMIDRRPVATLSLGAIAIGIAGSYEIGRRIAPHLPPVWLAPLMGAAFTASVVARVVSRRHAAGSVSAGELPESAA